MRVPNAGDVYINIRLEYVKVRMIHYLARGIHIEYYYLDEKSIKFYEEAFKHFELKFSYVRPEQYNRRLKGLLNEEMIRDIIE